MNEVKWLTDRLTDIWTDRHRPQLLSFLGFRIFQANKKNKSHIWSVWKISLIMTGGQNEE